MNFFKINQIDHQIMILHFSNFINNNDDKIRRMNYIFINGQTGMLMNKNRIAAIDIGSSSIRMSIAETIDGKINILEELRHPVKLGYDTFNKGKIARNTLNDAVLILKNFKKICTELNINKIKAVATTAVREASNSDIFVDNVRSYADIDVEVLSSIKETEYIFKSLTYHQNQSGNRQNRSCRIS